MIYCDNMEKRSIGNFVGVLVEIQLYMDNYAKEVMEVTKRNGGWRIKEMKRSYKKNGKKKKEKSVEKLHRSTIYAAKANSMYVIPLLMLPPHIISCVASILSSFTLSWVVTIHCTSSSLLYTFRVLLIFSVFCCLYVWPCVIIQNFLTPFWGSPYQHHHLFEG